MRHKRIALGALLLLAVLCVSPVAAAIGVTPGSSTSLMGFPVSQSFTGLTADTEYRISCTSDGNSSVTFTSDSDGKATVTQTPPETGANTYELRLSAGSSSLASWTVENTDIMIYIIPLFQLVIIFGVLGAVVKMIDF